MKVWKINNKSNSEQTWNKNEVFLTNFFWQPSLFSSAILKNKVWTLQCYTISHFYWKNRKKLFFYYDGFASMDEASISWNFEQNPRWCLSDWANQRKTRSYIHKVYKRVHQKLRSIYIALLTWNKCLNFYLIIILLLSSPTFTYFLCIIFFSILFSRHHELARLWVSEF